MCATRANLIAILPLLLLQLAACDDAHKPRRVDTRTFTPEQLRAAILDECLSNNDDLRNSLDRVVARVTLPDGTQVQACTELPNKVHVQALEKPAQVLVDAQGWSAADGKALDPAAVQHLSALRTLLDVATLGPLLRANECERTDADTLRVTTREGATWTVHLRAGTLLPETMTGSMGAVQIIDWLNPPGTWIPSHLQFAPLGVCEFYIMMADPIWDHDLFAPPVPAAEKAPPKPDKPKLVMPTGGEERPSTPKRVELPATKWIVVADPGSWPERSQVYARHHAELEAQHQHIAGFAGFAQEGEGAVMLIPFRQRPKGPEFKAPGEWVIRDQPVVPALLVYPPTGTFAEKVERGSAMLQEALRAAGMTAAGPILAQPFFSLEAGVPPTEKLNNPTVRMTVPIR